MTAKHELCLSPRCDCMSSCAVQEAADSERANGIKTGLEMADKFLTLTKNRKDVSSMSRAFVTSARIKSRSRQPHRRGTTTSASSLDSPQSGDNLIQGHAIDDC